MYVLPILKHTHILLLTIGSYGSSNYFCWCGGPRQTSVALDRLEFKSRLSDLWSAWLWTSFLIFSWLRCICKSVNGDNNGVYPIGILGGLNTYNKYPINGRYCYFFLRYFWSAIGWIHGYWTHIYGGPTVTALLSYYYVPGVLCFT